MNQNCPAPLPSGRAALDLVKGRPGGLGRTVLCTFGRASLIGFGMLAAGKRENLVRDAFAGALGVEGFVLAWAAYRASYDDLGEDNPIDRLIDRSRLSPKLAAKLNLAELTARQVVGLREEDAVRLLRSRGLTWRPVWRSEWRGDGITHAMTADLSIARVNLEVSSGVVTKAYVS